MKNKLTEMPIDPATGENKILDINGVYGRAVGHSIYDFYMREFTGVDPQTGLSQWKMLYDDKDGDGKFDARKDIAISSLTEYQHANPDANIQETVTDVYADATQKFNGKSVIPDLRGAIRLDAEYKGFTLSAQFLYQFGGYAVDGAYQSFMADGNPGANIWHQDMKDRWQKPGDITDVPRMSSGHDRNVNSTSTRFLTKTDMFAFNNLRLGYNFSHDFVKRMGLGTLSIFVTGDNLFVASARKGYNPMTAETGSSSTYTYVPLTTYSGGIRVAF